MDGVEAVLSETEPNPAFGAANADVFYQALEDAELCNAEPGLDEIPDELLEPQACTFGPLFEIIPDESVQLRGEEVLPGPP